MSSGGSEGGGESVDPGIVRRSVVAPTPLELQRRLNDMHVSTTAEVQQLRVMMEQVLARLGTIQVRGVQVDQHLDPRDRDNPPSLSGEGGSGTHPAGTSANALAPSSLPFGLSQQPTTVAAAAGEASASGVGTDHHDTSAIGDRRDDREGATTSTWPGAGTVALPTLPQQQERLLYSLVARLAGAATMEELREFGSSEISVGKIVDLEGPNPFPGAQRWTGPGAQPPRGSPEEVILFPLPQELQEWKLRNFNEEARKVFHELHAVLHFRFASLQMESERNDVILRMLRVANVPMLAIEALERVFKRALARELKELQLLMRRYQLYQAHIHGKEVALVEAIQKQRDEVAIFSDKELASVYAQFEQEAVRNAFKKKQKEMADKIFHSTTSASSSSSSTGTSGTSAGRGAAITQHPGGASNTGAPSHAGRGAGRGRPFPHAAKGGASGAGSTSGSTGSTTSA